MRKILERTDVFGTDVDSRDRGDFAARQNFRVYCQALCAFRIKDEGLGHLLLDRYRHLDGDAVELNQSLPVSCACARR